MSALRQVLGALWAAVWLRGRLVRLRLRRLFGGRSVADEGPDFHRAGADAPVEGIDYELAELPAELAARLDLVRAETLGAARETFRRRPRLTRSRRSRSIAVAIAALLGLGVVGAGASALVAGSTGVPAVDRLLGINEKALNDPDSSRRPGPGGSEVQPRSQGDSASVSVQLDDGSAITSTAYVARNGDICLGLVDGDGSGTTGDVNCISPDQLRASVDQDAGAILGIRRYGRIVVLNGLVSGQVIDATGRDRPIAVELGKPWMPSGEALGELRPFIAVGEGEANTFMRSYRFALQVRTSSGSSDIVP